MLDKNDCLNLRGVNYSPFSYDEERIRRELSYGRRVNLNSIRGWLSFRAWERFGKEYIIRLRNAIRVTYDCGYRTMPRVQSLLVKQALYGV